jgi:hypothetical protein
MEIDDRRDSLVNTDLKRFLRLHGSQVVCTDHPFGSGIDDNS